jgi:predicted cupin superfamily sugar epimerase
MDRRVAELVEMLKLQPHPEGGYFGEVFRSAASVAPGDGRDRRSALTSIYFLLAAGQHSRWHRLRSDEVWHFYEGDPLELLSIDESLERSNVQLLGAAGAGAPVGVVPAGYWQAARSTGAYSLVGCSVGPGFDFADFRLLDEDSGEAKTIRARFPDLAVLI